MFNPMLCKSFEDRAWAVQSDLEAGRFWLMQPKVDGVRAIVSKAGVFTRNGNPVCKALHRELSGFFREYPDLVLDGELHVRGTSDLSETITAIRADCPSVQFFCFDVVNEKCQLDRIKVLDLLCRQEQIGYIDDKSATICAVATGVLSGEASLSNFSGIKWDTVRVDGVIFRNPSGLYKGGRCSDLLKYKTFSEVDVIIEDIVFSGNRVVSAVVKTEDGKRINTTVSGTASYWKSQAFKGMAGVVRHTYSGTGKPRDHVLICVRNYD